MFDALNDVAVRLIKAVRVGKTLDAASLASYSQFAQDLKSVVLVFPGEGTVSIS